MIILKTRIFDKWAKAHGIQNGQLLKLAWELQQGLQDGILGGSLYKKRLAIAGKGKRGGGRTIIAYKKQRMLIFLLAYSKNKQADLSVAEKIACEELAKDILNMSAENVQRLIMNGEFVEIKVQQ